MGNCNKSLIAQGLKRIKEKHHLTIEAWAKMANIPESTVARYLSSSLNIPNFPYVCALLKCVNEPIDAFYDSIDQKTDAPVEALKLDAVPAAVVGDVVIDTPEAAADIQERIIVQAENMKALQTIIREKEAAINLLETKMEMMERMLEASEETSARRLHALQMLCSAQ